MKTVVYTQAGKIEFPNTTWFAQGNSYYVMEDDNDDFPIAQFSVDTVYGVASEGY